MEKFTALAIIVSVLAQAVSLFVLHKTVSEQAKRADIDHARRTHAERAERLRRAYAGLHKAAGYLDQAFRDLMLYPKGREYPGIVNTASPPADYFQFNRYERPKGLIEKARELAADAEAVIVLDHESDAALEIYRRRIDDALFDFFVDCSTDGAPLDAMERLDAFRTAIKEMEAAARNESESLPSASP